MAKNTATYTLIIIAALIFTFIFLHATTTRNTAKIETTLQAEPNTLEWGTLQHGETATRTVTLTNTGAEPTNPLTMTHNATVGTVQWDAEGKTLLPLASLTCTISLMVASSAPTGPFNFTITITG